MKKYDNATMSFKTFLGHFCCIKFIGMSFTSISFGDHIFWLLIAMANVRQASCSAKSHLLNQAEHFSVAGLASRRVAKCGFVHGEGSLYMEIVRVDEWRLD